MKSKKRMTRKKLLDLLDRYGISTEEWGKGSANSVSHLVKTLNEEDVFLKPLGDKLVLHINVAVVTVLIELRGIHLELREDKMVCTNGYVKRRCFSGSLGEKIKKREIVKSAVMRGLKEELRFKDPSLYHLEMREMEITTPKPSDWYPGLLDIYYRKHFHCRIDLELFKTEYMAFDNGREVHFVWVVKKIEKV